MSESLSCVFQCFPVNFAKFLRTSLLQNTSGRRLLEPETQHNRLSSQEWCNCQNKKISTRLECMCCHEIPEVKAFNLKGKSKTLLEYHWSGIYRSSCLQMLFKIGALKNFAIFTGINLCWSLF